MSAADRLVGSLVTRNNARIARVDGGRPNPRPPADAPWRADLERRWTEFAAEWHRFSEADGRLPRIDQVIAEDQGNTGTWRLGLLVADGRPVAHARRRFPVTVAALAGVPGLRSAMWSLLEPHSELPAHQGPDAGVLRYHLGIDCPPDAALQVGDTVVPYENGVGVLFDDTAPHAAWNRADRRRVTLFLEVERPLPGMARWANRAVARVISRDPRYREAPRRAEEWDTALNGG